MLGKKENNHMTGSISNISYLFVYMCIYLFNDQGTTSAFGFLKCCYFIHVSVTMVTLYIHDYFQQL